MKSNWMNKQVSLYNAHWDNTGRSATYRDILLSDFAKDLNTIKELRNMNKADENFNAKKVALKGRLQCFTPAALLAFKAKDNVQVIERTGMMQLDFDYKDIKEYDIEELKQSVFSLPFIGFCGRSCSGDGFYALVLIAEPERLSDYAEHCFEILKSYGIQPDESKGKKVENLRYVSYDSNMLIRDNPEPLKVTHFRRKEVKKASTYTSANREYKSNNLGLINKKISEVLNVVVGERWAVVQRAAYTLGGLSDSQAIYLIEDAIRSNSSFSGQEDKYLKCANICFKEGLLNPLKSLSNA